MLEYVDVGAGSIRTLIRIRETDNLNIYNVMRRIVLCGVWYVVEMCEKIMESNIMLHAVYTKLL